MVAIRSGSVIAGKYRLEALLAQGGMGSVWSARHLTLDTRLAIKFIGPDVDGLDEARTRFEREAKVAALLQSPHVVQVLDYGIDGGVPYLAMELLQGEDLGARLARCGRLSIPETVAVVTQVARALRRAADAGIVHRDLKPGNVFMVRADDEEEIVKVLDFGVAKAPRLATDDTTRSGVMIGSPRYMSPEQVRGSRTVDHRGDLWSLAVIAYRALTGQLPFQGTDVADLIVKICTERAAPPSAIEPSLEPEIDDFFERALARDPDQRFQTARDFALAFASAAGEAPPPSVTGQHLALLSRMASLPPRASSPSCPSMPARLAMPSRPSSASWPDVAPSVLDGPAREPMASAPSIERTRTSLDAPRPRREASRPSGEPIPIQRSSDPEGTLTAAPRSIEVRARRAVDAPRRLRLAHVMIAGGIALAALAGVFAGRAVRPSSVVVHVPVAPAAPVAASAVPIAATVLSGPPVAPATAVIGTGAPDPALAPTATPSGDPKTPPANGTAAPAPSGKARSHRKFEPLGI
ncbi:MAG: protein kinase [Minicystis sp.]